MANEKKTPEQARYQKLVKERMPKSRTLSQCIRAFISGGIICCIGQLMRNWAQQGMGLDEKGTAAFTAIVMVFLGATLTGIGVYDKIGEWSGAGSIVHCIVKAIYKLVHICHNDPSTNHYSENRNIPQYTNSR